VRQSVQSVELSQARSTTVLFDAHTYRLNRSAMLSLEVRELRR
jgi:hypothetical protein